MSQRRPKSSHGGLGLRDSPRNPRAPNLESEANPPPPHVGRLASKVGKRREVGCVCGCLSVDFLRTGF